MKLVMALVEVIWLGIGFTLLPLYALKINYLGNFPIDDLAPFISVPRILSSIS